MRSNPGERQAGWVDVDLFAFWCLACAPDVTDALRLAGLGAADRGAFSPVGVEWASRQPLTCEGCGRRL